MKSHQVCLKKSEQRKRMWEVKLNLGSLTNDAFLFCSGQRASLYSPGVVQPYDRILASDRSHEWYWQRDGTLVEWLGGRSEGHDPS